MIRAATTPGTHPQIVNIKTITIDPQPLSITAKGGKRMLSKTRHMLINSKDKDTLINTDRTAEAAMCYAVRCGFFLRFIFPTFECEVFCTHSTVYDAASIGLVAICL